MKKTGRKSRDCRQGPTTLQLSGWLAAIFFLLSGCARYHPMPLAKDAVQAQLLPPDFTELRLEAATIHHPLLPPVKLQPGQGLTPDSAAILAVLINPALRAVRDRRALADAQVLSAGLLPDPELSFGFAVPTGGTQGRVNAFGLGLNWNISALLTRSLHIDRAKASKKAILLDIAWQEWQVAMAAKDAVYQLVSLQNRVALAGELHHLTSKRLAWMQDALTAGMITRDELAKSLSDDRDTGQSLLRLKKEARQQNLQLLRILGMPSSSRINLNRDIVLSARIKLPSHKKLMRGLEQRRLDLLALRRGYDAQEASVRVAIMNQFPKIGLGPTFNRDTDNIRTTGFSLTVSLPVFNRNQGNIALEEATRKRLFDEYANRVFETGSDIDLIVSGIRFTNRQVAQAQMAESDLNRLAKTYRSELARGRVDARSYDAVREDLLKARMQTAALKGQLAKDLVGLELATGEYRIPPDANDIMKNKVNS